jgi:hypothetical protein
MMRQPNTILGLESMHQVYNRIVAASAAVTAVLMTTQGALAETTIDSGAKPYFIMGGVIATILFTSIGAMLIRKGNRNLRIAAAAAQWPVVTGKVLSSEVVKRIDKTEDGPVVVFTPQVHYVYNADGVRLDGRVIQIGLEERGCVERLAHDYIAKYSVGSRAPVRFDPQNPANAVLELGQIGGGSNLFAGILLALVGLGGVAFTVFSIVTPSN